MSSKSSTYSELELRAVQLAKLNILKEFDRVCRKINTHYFLTYGTALGALRHQGFIPWNDSLDVGMLREEYEIFIEQAPDFLQERYRLQNFQSDKQAIYLYSKLTLKDSELEVDEQAGACLQDGIAINLLVYSNLPNNQREREQYMSYCRNLSRLFMISSLNEDKNKEALKLSDRLMMFFLKIYYGYLKETKKERIYSDLINKVHKYSKIVADEVWVEFYDDSVVPRETISVTHLVPFEDQKFPVPMFAQDYLTRTYGNWQEYPPESDRISKLPSKLRLPQEFIEQAQKELAER
ncbi:MAG: LicD family protein [Coriobacteriia bacterium]|nr:LicD family protein [Coriobacteriia bacterium]